MRDSNQRSPTYRAYESRGVLDNMDIASIGRIVRISHLATPLVIHIGVIHLKIVSLMPARSECFIPGGGFVCSGHSRPQQSHFWHTMILDRPVGVTIFSTLLKYPCRSSFSCRRTEMALPVPMEARRM